MSTAQDPQSRTWSRRRVLMAGAAGAAAVFTGACTSTKRPEPFGGSVLDPPYSKPDVTLETMNGDPFPFREATKGKLTLLFLGYTHCPDQCPVWLNTVARAREAIGSGPGSRPLVLFVGIDLKRDTPAVLKQYLGRIDETFMGLTGSRAQIDDLIDSLHFAPLMIGKPDANGDYDVGHYSRSIAYSPDNQGHRLYSFDVTQAELVHDLPRLARNDFE